MKPQTAAGRLLRCGVLSALVPLALSAQMILRVEAQTQHVESIVVVRAAGMAIGDRLTRDNLQEAVRRIYATGLFARVQADTTMIADGVRVRFEVVEFPRLRKGGLQFIGNHKVSTKELTGKLSAKGAEASGGPPPERPEGGEEPKPGGPEGGPGAKPEKSAAKPSSVGGQELLTEKKVFEWTQRISDLYKDKGFVLSKVSSRVTPTDDQGQAGVIFTIEEGDRIRIRKVTIEGDSLVKEGVILKKLVNKAYRWPFQNGKFKDDEFKKDLDRVTELYKEKGCLDAKVLDYDLRYDSGWVYVTIKVDEGLTYYFGALDFAGESLFTTATLGPILRAKRGAVYNQKRINDFLTEVAGMYAEQGYIYTQVSPRDSIRNDTVDIRFQIAENQPARVRLVSIEGNDRTIDKVIRREIVSMPGATFKRSEVIRSQQNIFNLGFFEDVQLDYKKLSDTTGDIDLTYKVKEKFPGSVGAGVSYSATDGFVGNATFTQPNMFGRGWQLNILYEKGAKTQNASLGFTEPWLFDTPTSAGINLSWLTRNYTYYDKRDRGGDVSFSRPLPLDYTRGYATLHVGDVTLSKISSGTSTPQDDTLPKMTVSTTFRFDRDSRDYVFNPSSGSLNSYSVELAGARVLGDVHYQRHVFESNFYYPLFWKFVLRLRSRFGFVSGLGSRDTVPAYVRFYPGGSGDDGIRGYSDRSLPNLSGYNPGGQTEAIFSLEYRLKLSRSLTALAFFDAGNAWESIREVNLSNLKRGVGAGVRIEIPMMGWLGFDLGYGIDRPGATKLEPHFQLGTGFPISF